MKRKLFITAFCFMALACASCSSDEEKKPEKANCVNKQELNITINSPAFQERKDEPMPPAQSSKPNPLDY